MAKCAILDFEKGEIKIISIATNLSDEEIEKILTERYEYSLNGIEWMAVNDLKLTIE